MGQPTPGTVLAFLGSALLVAVWVAWIWLVFCAVVELVFELTGRPRVRLPGGRRLQVVTGLVVGAVIALGAMRTPPGPHQGAKMTVVPTHQVLPVVPFGAGIVGVGLSDLLDRLRIVQQRHRLTGHDVPRPDDGMKQVELGLRAGSGRDTLLSVGIALASIRGEVDAVVVDDREVHVVTRDDNEHRFLRPTLVGPSAPLPPFLVTVGRIGDATLLVNLAPLGFLSVGGDHEVVDGFLRATALELAARPSHQGVVVVGFGREFLMFPGVEWFAETDDLMDELSAMVPDEAVVVICGPHVGERQLSRLWSSLANRPQTTLIGRGAVGTTHWDLDHLAGPRGRHVVPQRITRSELRGVATVVEGLHEPSVPFRDSLPTAFMPRVEEVVVEVMGEVRIRGAARPFHRAWSQELVIYLAMHPDGVSTEAWATALWPERIMAATSLHSTASVARRALGVDANGSDHLPRSHGRLRLGSSVTTDWTRFERLSAVQTRESWHQALALVRGRLFEGLRSADWTVLEGIAPAMEARIVDLSGRLSGASLAAHDPDEAEWAARQGLRVSPYDERLYRMLMRAADAGGNPAGVEAVMHELVTLVAEEIEPLDSIHPATVDLYRSLSRRPKRLTVG